MGISYYGIRTKSLTQVVVAPVTARAIQLVADVETAVLLFIMSTALLLCMGMEHHLHGAYGRDS